MKKTLLGVLAFVLVLVTVLTGTVLAADEPTTNTANLGEVKMVDADHPILVDGKMDDAYKTAIALPIVFGGAGAPADLYTRGVARFVWSKAENAVYCLVIVNDVDVAAPGQYPWNSDSVELFLDLTNTGVQSWGIDGLNGEGKLRRGLQYRMEGNKGVATCYLEEEPYMDGAPDQTTYYYDEELGRMANDAGNLLINENRNMFGWNYSEDPTKRGWGYSLTDYGYMVEFRIGGEGQGVTLQDGLTFRFDFQLNDRHNVNLDGSGGNQVVFYYASTFRKNTFVPGVTDANTLLGGDPTENHDTLTLSEEVVSNNNHEQTKTEMEKYGVEDATYPAKSTTVSTERTYTQKHQIATRTKKDYGNVSTTSKKPAGGNNNTTGNGGGAGGAGSGSDTTGGGCGGSIAIGTSVAMIALVGGAGFFAFRRKDEE